MDRREYTLNFIKEVLASTGDVPDFSDQEWAALCEEAPMTQGLFERCLLTCAEAGNILEFFDLFRRWPEHGRVWCEQLDKGLDTWDAYLEAQGVEPKKLTDDDIRTHWTAFKARVRDELGDETADGLTDDILSI